MSRLLARLGVVLTGAVALIAGGGSVAAAHVTVHADQAVQGGSAEIGFQVPTETDTASTVSVRVAFPADAPIAEVAVLPVEGWTFHVTTTAPASPVAATHGDEASEVVREVEWRAAGPGIKPGEYQVFRIAGELPKTDRMVFKVVQTYDDGQVVRWIDEPVAGGPEPAHPAPVLALTDAPAADGHGAPAVVLSSSPAPPSQAAWWTAMAIALLALGTALVAMVIAIPAGRRSRKVSDEPDA
jgi:uncharacterized protein YcnI